MLGDSQYHSKNNNIVILCIPEGKTAWKHQGGARFGFSLLARLATAGFLVAVALALGVQQLPRRSHSLGRGEPKARARTRRPGDTDRWKRRKPLAFREVNLNTSKIL